LPRPTRKAIASTAHEIIGTMSVLVNRSVIISYILLSLVSAISLCVILSSVSSISSCITNGTNRFDDFGPGVSEE